MLQLEQARNQSWRQSRAFSGGDEVPREIRFDAPPVHERRQANKRVSHLELLVKTGAEQLCGLGGECCRPTNTSLKFAGNQTLGLSCLANTNPPNQRNLWNIQLVRSCSARAI